MKRKSINLLHGEAEEQGWSIYAEIHTDGKVMENRINLLNKKYSHRKALSGTDYYLKHRVHIRQRDNETRIKKWLFKNGGFCWICGEFDPRYLEEHHVFDREDEFTINLCANCHRKYRSTKGDNHKLFILRRLAYV